MRAAVGFGEVWTASHIELDCERTGTTHALSVSTPFRYGQVDETPLILCLDGAWVAGTVRDATRIMSMSGEAPEAVVAGLSFTDTSMGAYLRSRARWFCPTQWVPPEITGVKGVTADQTGHALTYLAFIRDQVLAHLRDQYRVSEVWLVGHSFSALFGLRSLFAEPGLFDKYLLASPSIWWHDRAIFDFEAEYAASHDDLAARVFMSTGEEEAGLGSEFNMGDNMVDMANRLDARNYPSLSLDHLVLPAESHSSTIGAAVSRGIRSLHPPG